MRNKYNIPYPSDTNDYSNYYYHNILKQKDIVRDKYIKQNIKADNRRDYHRQYYYKNKDTKYNYTKVEKISLTQKISLTEKPLFRVNKGNYILTFD